MYNKKYIGTYSGEENAHKVFQKCLEEGLKKEDEENIVVASKKWEEKI